MNKDDETTAKELQSELANIGTSVCTKTCFERSSLARMDQAWDSILPNDSRT